MASHYDDEISGLSQEEKHMEAHELRALLDEYTHQISHLERSQCELRHALIKAPDDADFLSAVEENDQIIKQRKEKIAQLRELLRRTDPAYCEEKKAEDRLERWLGSPIRSPESNIIGNGEATLLDRTVSATLAPQQQQQEQPPYLHGNHDHREGGIYL
jgi:hypothetical protein